jgi:signal recognition particle subunit SRP54
VQIAKRAKTQASLGGYDVYMLDTAGRLHIDEVLMDEVQAVRDVANPRETLLVVDGLTGQDAVNVATEFDGKVGISGVILTRMDGDGRGGAALSMRAVTGKPIRFVGLGEKIRRAGDLRARAHRRPHPRHGRHRRAGREGAGDAGGRAGRAHDEALPEGSVQHERPEDAAGTDAEDGRHAGRHGDDARHGQDAKQAEAAGFDDKMLKRQIALIQSMTKKERANPDLLQASRKKRIAAGAGWRCPSSTSFSRCTARWLT